jgi:hypothetical protein
MRHCFWRGLKDWKRLERARDNNTAGRILLGFSRLDSEIGPPRNSQRKTEYIERPAMKGKSKTEKNQE